MSYDAQGLAISTEDEAGEAYRFAVEGYMHYSADLAARVAKLLEADPGFALGHVLAGYLAMMPLNVSLLGNARRALLQAQQHAATATHRERSHVAALGFWVDGNLDRALSVWEEILSTHPRDLLAFRLHHNVAFWYGLPGRMLQVARTVKPHWNDQVPGYGTVLACNAFALEESGQYNDAEKEGWSAVNAEPGNVWATHALTHVMEMQGRRAEGIRLLSELEPHWEATNHFKHHLWWHRAMFHLELHQFHEVLHLYDNRFRDLSSPLSRAVPDLYNDVLNATSMLFRLELQGIATGNRWEELADLGEARMGDTLSTLTLPHWTMALAGAQRWDAVNRSMSEIEEAIPHQHGDRPAILRDIAVPVSRAVYFYGRKDYAASVESILPALPGLQRLGGSHAQRDVFHQLFIHAAMKAGRTDLVRQHLDHARATHPVAPRDRIGYAAAAQSVPG